MRTSHDGLQISESDWDDFARHAIASLEDLGVAPKEKNDVLALAASLKADIVEVAQTSGAKV